MNTNPRVSPRPSSGGERREARAKDERQDHDDDDGNGDGDGDGDYDDDGGDDDDDERELAVHHTPLVQIEAHADDISSCIFITHIIKNIVFLSGS